MKLNRASIGMCLMCFTIACMIYGQEKKNNSGDVSGTWECIAHGSVEGDVPFTMRLEQKGETIEGAISTHTGEINITSGSFKENMLEIHCDTPDANYLVTGKLKQEHLSGHWAKGTEQEGAWEGKRATSADQSSQ